MASAQLHQAALDEIGQEIVDGRHPVGSVLTLADLERLAGEIQVDLTVG